MGQRRGGSGFVVLLVVMAIVLLLTAHVWKKIAPGAGTAPVSPAAAEQSVTLGAGASETMAPPPANGPAATQRAREVRDQVNANTAQVKKSLEETP